MFVCRFLKKKTKEWRTDEEKSSFSLFPCFCYSRHSSISPLSGYLYFINSSSCVSSSDVSAAPYRFVWARISPWLSSFVSKQEQPAALLLCMLCHTSSDTA